MREIVGTRSLLSNASNEIEMCEFVKMNEWRCRDAPCEK